jgi:hypothetical protein
MIDEHDHVIDCI